MKADLHMHSVYSDGLHTPLELALRARQVGFDLICITDHDNMGGEEEKRRAFAQCGIPYIRGWEVSTVSDRKVHVLGYNCSFGKAYDDFLAKRKEEASERVEQLIQKSNEFFKIDVTMQDVEEECALKGNVLHPMYAVRAVAKRIGRAGNGIDVFKEFFDKGDPCYVPPKRPTPEEAINVIHELGGVAVLAHPGRMRLYGKLDLLEGLVKSGIDGIECYYTTHTVEETEQYLAFAHKHKLYVTGGSDFHFDGGKPVFGKPDYTADENFLARVLPSREAVG